MSVRSILALGAILPAAIIWAVDPFHVIVILTIQVFCLGGFIFCKGDES